MFSMIFNNLNVVEERLSNNFVVTSNKIITLVHMTVSLYVQNVGNKNQALVPEILG